MGGAGAASSEGSEAFFWNPAGLAARSGEGSLSDLTVGYSSLLETTYAGSAAYARPVPYGVFGAGLTYFSQSAQTAYSNVGDATGQFTPNDLAAGVGFAGQYKGTLVGGVVKAIRSSVSSASGSTAAVDLGVQSRQVTYAGEGAVDLGASLTNLGPPIKVGSTASALPFAARGGFFWHANPILGVALDAVLPVDADPYVALGVEAALKEPTWKAALRVGFNQNRTRGIDGLVGISAGAGIDFQRLRFDYAWVPFGDLGQTSRIMLGFMF